MHCVYFKIQIQVEVQAEVCYTTMGLYLFAATSLLGRCVDKNMYIILIIFPFL